MTIPLLTQTQKTICTKVFGERRKHEHSNISKSEEEERVTQSLSPPLLSLGKGAVPCFQSSPENLTEMVYSFELHCHSLSRKNP